MLALTLWIKNLVCSSVTNINVQYDIILDKQKNKQTKNMPPPMYRIRLLNDLLLSGLFSHCLHTCSWALGQEASFNLPWLKDRLLTILRLMLQQTDPCIHIHTQMHACMHTIHWLTNTHTVQLQLRSETDRLLERNQLHTLLAVMISLHQHKRQWAMKVSCNVL